LLLCPECVVECPVDPVVLAVVVEDDVPCEPLHQPLAPACVVVPDLLLPVDVVVHVVPDVLPAEDEPAAWLVPD
jgi:hypothetical protein